MKKGEKGKNPAQPKEMIVEGIKYESQKACAAAYGVDQGTLSYRLKAGKSIEDALGLGESLQWKGQLERIARSQSKSVEEVVIEADRLLVERKEERDIFIKNQNKLNALKSEKLKLLLADTNKGLLAKQDLDCDKVIKICRSYITTQIALLHDDLFVVANYADDVGVKLNLKDDIIVTNVNTITKWEKIVNKLLSKK